MQKYRSRRLLAAAAASVGMAALLTPDARAYLELDLQATYIKDSPDYINGVPFADPKNIIANIGDTVLMDIVVRVKGTNSVQRIGNFDGRAPASDTANDDSFSTLAGGFKSVGGLRGNFDTTDHSGQVPPFGTTGASPGVLQDFDSDGDLDLGAVGTDPQSMWIAHAARPQAATISLSNVSGTRFGVSSTVVPDFTEDTGGELAQIPKSRIIDASTSQMLVGELVWVVTDGSGAGDVNFVPRANFDATTAQWIEDGITTGKNPSTSSLFLGLPVHIELAGGNTPNQVWNPGPTTWNTSSSNWLNQGSPSLFANGDGANFTDAGVGPVVVDGGGVSPKRVNISNSIGTYTFSGGSINGSGGLIKAGAGTAVLSSPNGYTGGTTVTGGVLVIDGGDNRLGAPAAPISLNGGTLRTSSTGISSTRTLFVDYAGGNFDTNGFDSTLGALTGGGVFIKSGSGTLTLLGTSTHTGLKKILDGALRVGNGGTSGSLTGDVSLMNPSAQLIFNRSDDSTYAGSVSGAGSITKLGSGTLELQNGVSPLGGTYIQQGVVRISAGGSLNGDVVNNGVLQDDRNGSSFTLAGNISGSGSFIKSGSSRLFLLGANTYTGGTTITQGELTIADGGSTSSIAGNVALQNGALLSFNPGINNSVTVAGNVSGNGALTQWGDGTVILTGTNTYSGPTSIPHGTLRVGDGGTTGTIPNNTVVLTNFPTLSTGTLVFNRSDSLTFAGDIRGGVTYKEGAGTLVLTGLMTDQGGAFIRAGTLQFGNGGTTGFNDGANITNQGALIFNRSDSIAYIGVIFGSGTFIKQGSGTLTLTKPMVYTGPTLVSAGTLSLGADLNTGSAINVAPGARLDIQKNRLITKSPVGTLVGSTYTGVTGLIQSGHNGTVLPLWDGSGIVTSQSSATGGNYTSIGVARASDVRPATATATGTWAGQTITGTDTLVMYTYGGDANLDGKLGIDDYVRVDAGLGGHLSGWSNGDFNYDGVVNIDDYAIIDSNVVTQGAPFPTAAGIAADGGPTTETTAVPEPAPIGLGAMSMAFAIASRKRRKR